jgi:DNA-binding transcriptional ArsR family regulator
MVDIIEQIEILKALADESRLLIIKTLQNSGPKTAGEIEKIINKSQSSTSKILAKMSNILTFTKKWNEKYFDVKDKQLFQIIESLESYVQNTSVYSLSGSTLFQKGESILFLGTNASGKTSIILSLASINCPLSELKSTNGLRSIEDICKELKINIPKPLEMHLFEGGGSKNFRDEYLKNPKQTLFNFDKIVFVIDVQNKEGPIPYINALNYLKDVIYALTESIKLKEFIVLLHKVDLGLESNSEFTTKFIDEKLINPIKKAMPPEFSYRIFKTSLMNSFRRMLISQSFKT